MATETAQNEPSEAKRPFARLGRDLKTVAELASIGSAFAFILAVAYNQAIFSFWGLNFLQIARPSDVLMSGIDVFLRISLPISILIVGYLTGKRYANEGPERRAILYASATTLLFVVACLVLIDPPYEVRQNIGLLVSAFPAGYMFAALIGYRGQTFRRFIRIFTVIYGGIVLLLVAITFMYASTGVIFNGFTRQKFAIGSDEICAGRVLWLGESSVVVRCEDRRTAVAYGPENLSFYSEKRFIASQRPPEAGH